MGDIIKRDIFRIHGCSANREQVFAQVAKAYTHFGDGDRFDRWLTLRVEVGHEAYLQAEAWLYSSNSEEALAVFRDRANA